MKFILVFFLFCLQKSFSQSTNPFFIKEIGWTITLPPAFHVIDSSTLSAETRENEKTIHWIKKPTDTNYNKLLLLIRDNHLHELTLTYVDTVHSKQDSNFSDFDQRLKRYGKSVASTEIYGGVRFFKLETKMKVGAGYTIINLRTVHNGKVFMIVYSYDNKDLQDDLETMLKTSRFDW